VVGRLPPEYLPAEERPARIAELEQEVAREWRRFAIAEAIVIWLPFACFLALFFLTDAIPDDALVPVVVCAAVAMGLLVTYWVVRRILPLSREIEALRALGART
jgi:hypothetical protein